MQTTQDDTRQRNPMPFSELANLPAVLTIPEAGRAGWGFSRQRSYELAQAGDFPCAVQRVGARFHVRTADVLKALGLDPLEVMRAAREQAN